MGGNGERVVGGKNKRSGAVMAKAPPHSPWREASFLSRMGNQGSVRAFQKEMYPLAAQEDQIIAKTTQTQAAPRTAQKPKR